MMKMNLNNNTMTKLSGIILFIFLGSTMSFGQLVINEAHPRVIADNVATPQVEGDINGDGVRVPTQDEFIELVNTGASQLDISTWSICQGATGSAAPGTIR